MYSRSLISGDTLGLRKRCQSKKWGMPLVEAKVTVPLDLTLACTLHIIKLVVYILNFLLAFLFPF